jgi:hypothetical protein
MSETPQLPDHFVEAFGPPDEATAPMHFSEPFLEQDWTWRCRRTGAGWFLGRFFFLLGDGLGRFTPCLEAWSLLLSTPANERKIIGYNAYGALLVLENELDRGVVAPVRLVEPTNVVYWGDPECAYGTLLNRWLPSRLVPHFFDTSVYEQWLKSSGRFLGDGEILGIRAALPLGGEMKLDNFSPMNIVDYYRATGPAYAKAREQFERGK